ncbi:MAG: hypothetical protein ACXAEF_10825 [Candidatus Thorarchaeota archaeon]
MTLADYFAHNSWSLGGHSSGHISPLPAYTVTSLCILEANMMKRTSSKNFNGNNSNDLNNSQFVDPVLRIYNYHWSVTE